MRVYLNYILNAAPVLEPELVCAGALLSLETGIVDSHVYMLALRSCRLMLNCDLSRLRE